MATFDPYHKWLGIPPSERPINHYRLLGVTLFEADPDVIDAATEQRVAFLRQCATGQHIAESQKLLNEVAAARLCLLNAPKKSEYDQRLRDSLRPSEPAIAAGEEEPWENFPKELFDHSEMLDAAPQAAGIQRSRKKGSRSAIKLTRTQIAVAGVAIVVVLLAVLLMSSGKEDATPESDSTATASDGDKRIAARQSEGKAKLEQVFTNTLDMELLLIPAGDYQRGISDKDVEAAIAAANLSLAERRDFSNEQPQHRVRITKPFYMARFETTQEQFQKLLGRNPSGFRPSAEAKDKVRDLDTQQFPVERVSWFDAVEFCNKLSLAENKSPCYELLSIERNEDSSIKNADVRLRNGGGYRLPTEAEWEFACRAGTTTPFHFGKELNGDKANVNGDFPFGTATHGTNLQRPTKVGSYPANAFGLHDLHGNVWEWCQDGYDAKAYLPFAKSDAVDPTGPATAQHQVLRGGSWSDYSATSLSVTRFADSPSFRSTNLGFRVVCKGG